MELHYKAKIKDNITGYISFGTVYFDGATENYQDTYILLLTKAEFPKQGEDNTLYIASDENLIYRWDIDINDYVVVDPKYIGIDASINI